MGKLWGNPLSLMSEKKSWNTYKTPANTQAMSLVTPLFHGVQRSDGMAWPISKAQECIILNKINYYKKK